MKKIIIRRIIMYFAGLFIMTMGIALSVKSNLGVSPVSSIPYSMTCIWGIEMGKATIIFHCVLVFIQIILLRKKFKIKNLLQVVVGIIFGYFTTICNYGASFIPVSDNILIRIALSLASAFFIAFGIFLYLPTDIMPLAGEGAMQAVAEVSGVDFSKVKIGFDVSMVTISLIACLICLHTLGSVGAGTVIAAFLVGIIHGFFVKKFSRIRDGFLRKE